MKGINVTDSVRPSNEWHQDFIVRDAEENEHDNSDWDLCVCNPGSPQNVAAMAERESEEQDEF